MRTIKHCPCGKPGTMTYLLEDAEQEWHPACAIRELAAERAAHERTRQDLDAAECAVTGMRYGDSTILCLLADLGAPCDAIASGIVTLAKELDTLRAECAQISAEFDLPPTIRPAEGEIRRMREEATSARADLAAASTLAAQMSTERDEARQRLAEVEAARDENYQAHHRQIRRLCEVLGVTCDGAGVRLIDRAEVVMRQVSRLAEVEAQAAAMREAIACLRGVRDTTEQERAEAQARLGAAIASDASRAQAAEVEALRGLEPALALMAAAGWDDPQWECGHGCHVQDCDDPGCEPRAAYVVVSAALARLDAARKVQP